MNLIAKNIGFIIGLRNHIGCMKINQGERFQKILKVFKFPKMEDF
jgi:hypothetical protein